MVLSTRSDLARRAGAWHKLARNNRMPIAKELRTDPALEAQVFWYKYRKEIAILLVFAIVALIGIAGYRLYRGRREATASKLFRAAKTPAADAEAISRHAA